MSKSKPLASKNKGSSSKAKDDGIEIVDYTGVWWTLSQEGCVIANDDPYAKELREEVEGFGSPYGVCLHTTGGVVRMCCVECLGVLFFNFLFWGGVCSLRA